MILLLSSLFSPTACTRPVQLSAGPSASRAALVCEAVDLSDEEPQAGDRSLVFPGILEQEALLSGNPLATYSAMRELEGQYLASGMFSGIYPEVRLNFEQFLGMPCAAVQAMNLLAPSRQADTDADPEQVFAAYRPQPAVEAVRDGASRTRVVIWGEEHHMPQTRSLYVAMLEALWGEGYRYLAAEAFEDADMSRFATPTYESGYYLRDPVYASAVRHAQEMGYTLVSYDTRERGPEGESSFRDVTQAQNLAAVLAADPRSRLIVLAGRGHASETASRGWTPMAHVLKTITGIDPFTVYAPTMSERLTAEEEDELYRSATSRGLVAEPVLFRRRDGDRFLGSKSFDAYVFWPRTRLIGGRPDWMVTVLERVPTPIPGRLVDRERPILIQAFRLGAPPSTIPSDQVMITSGTASPPVLMLDKGKYWLRSIGHLGVESPRVEIAVH